MVSPVSTSAMMMVAAQSDMLVHLRQAPLLETASLLYLEAAAVEHPVAAGNVMKLWSVREGEQGTRRDQVYQNIVRSVTATPCVSLSLEQHQRDAGKC